MNYGLYLSATGALTAMHRQDVIANNLANVQTVGFKRDLVHFNARLPERLERAGFGPISPQHLLEELGGGHFVAPSATDHSQGEILPTGNNLDVALSGDGFLAVRSDAGDVRLTRDGRMSLDQHGRLVLTANGMNVLDVNDRPIQLRTDAPIQIAPNGSIQQDGETVATLQVTNVADTASMRKTGDNLFAPHPGMELQRTPATAKLIAGHVESSGVDPIMALNAMINATKSVQANTKLIQFHDTLNDQTINRFGRVA